MHTLNPGAAAGAHESRLLGHSKVGLIRHDMPTVFHVGGAGICALEGAHVPSSTVSAPIVTDWTQWTPEQSLPDGIASVVSHAPAQPLAGSKGVCGVDAPFCAQEAALAVIASGSAHEPCGCPQVQAPHPGGASMSAYPLYPR